jgi:E3 ubiquitin-protein ligase BAH
MQTQVSPLNHSLVYPGNEANANADNLDTEQAAFLKKWFPEEVKNKQRYNELMAGVDQYGEVYASEKCVVM